MGKTLISNIIIRDSQFEGAEKDKLIEHVENLKTEDVIITQK